MDSLLLRERVIAGQDALIAVVCDGVGALEDGAFAASTAVRMLSDWFGGLDTAERIGLRMRDAALAINAHIVAKAKAEAKNTASTLSALLLLGDMYYIVHVGDSRIYSFSQGVLAQLTKDDTAESGQLKSCIGRKEDIVLYYTEGTAGPMTFLLCTDGLYKRMDLQLMLAKMDFGSKKSLKKAIASLTQYVIGQDERDNISLALVKKYES